MFVQIVVYFVLNVMLDSLRQMMVAVLQILAGLMMNSEDVSNVILKTNLVNSISLKMRLVFLNVLDSMSKLLQTPALLNVQLDSILQSMNAKSVMLLDANLAYMMDSVLNALKVMAHAH